MEGLPIGLMLRLGEVSDLDELRRLVLGVEGSFDGLILEEGAGSKLDPVVTLAHLAQLCDVAAFGLFLRSDNGRPPSVVAKLVSGIDLTTEGRAFVVMGSLSDVIGQEYERTEDALRLINEMVASDTTTYQGPYFAVDDAWNTPRWTVPLPGFAKVGHAMVLHEVLDRSRIGRPLPRDLVVEIGQASPDDRSRLVELFDDYAENRSRTAVITVVSTAQDIVVPPDDVRASFDALVYRFEHHPTERQLRALA